MDSTERNKNNVAFVVVCVSVVLAIYALAAHLDNKADAALLKARQEFCERHADRCPPLHHERHPQ